MLLSEDLGIISRMLTPSELLMKTDHVEATKILPDQARNFNDLLRKRQDICHLRWLPVKTEKQRAEYKQISQVTELDELLSKMGSSKVGIFKNKYPYLLPPDVVQRIIWVKPETSSIEVEGFIAKLLLHWYLDPAEVICFERPMGCSTPMVRGTFPHLRHIHFWTIK